MHEFLAYRVADAMSPRPMAIAPHTPLAAVEQLFEEHDFNALPVVEGERLVGVITKLDVLKAFTFTRETAIPPYEDIMRQPAGQVMTRTPHTVTPDVPLTRVLAAMVETRNKSFPVLDRDRLVGMIARADVLRALRCAAAGEPPSRGPRRG